MHCIRLMPLWIALALLSGFLSASRSIADGDTPRMCTVSKALITFWNPAKIPVCNTTSNPAAWWSWDRATDRWGAKMGGWLCYLGKVAPVRWRRDVGREKREQANVVWDRVTSPVEIYVRMVLQDAWAREHIASGEGVSYLASLE